MRLIKLVIVIFLLLGLSPVALAYQSWLHGEIVEVFPEQHKVRIVADGKTKILELDEEVEIYRGGYQVSLISTRPIAPDRFQEGLFLVNTENKVILFIVDYRIAEIETESGSAIIYYDIFGQIKDIVEYPSFERDPLIYSE